MKMNIDENYDLYEKIVENQSMWPTNMNNPKKAGIYNVDAVTTLVAQMKVLT